VVADIDENLQALLVTESVGDTLVIRQTDSFATSNARVEVTLPKLLGAADNGSGSMTVSGFSDPNPITLSVTGSGSLDFSGASTTLSLENTGSGSTQLHGQGSALTAEVEGSGSLSAEDFTAATATLSVDGSGSIHCTVTGKVSAHDSGSGSIVIGGGAAIEDASRSGSGSITTE
jgi:hypothetical protein